MNDMRRNLGNITALVLLLRKYNKLSIVPQSLKFNTTFTLRQNTSLRPFMFNHTDIYNEQSIGNPIGLPVVIRVSMPE